MNGPSPVCYPCCPICCQNDYENAAKLFDPHLHPTGVNQVRVFIMVTAHAVVVIVLVLVSTHESTH
jgi:hypothetical protein